MSVQGKGSQFCGITDSLMGELAHKLNPKTECSLDSYRNREETLERESSRAGRPETGAVG